MFQIYLPIAGVYTNFVSLGIIGIITGVLAGMFGVGGTFFTIPALAMLGIPPTAAIASCTLQMVASAASLSNFYWKNGLVDVKLASLTFIGAFVGSIAGGQMFVYLNSINQINSAVAMIYIFVLGSIATYMIQESVRAINAKRKNIVLASRDSVYNFFYKWPMRVELERFDVQVSAVFVFCLGFFGAVIVALAGISGSFLIIPTFIYLVRIPTSSALGTSNMVSFGSVIMSAFIQCFFSKSVDLVLASILIVTSVVGVRIGSSVYKKIPPEELRLILSIIMFGLILKFVIQISMPTSDLFSFSVILH